MIVNSWGIIAVVGAVTTSIHVAVTAPTPSPPKKDRIKADYTPLLYVFLNVLRASVWVHGAIEVSLLLSRAMAPTSSMTLNLYTLLSMDDTMGTKTIFLSPFRLAAGIIVIVGGAIRWLAYREMGRHFTYHITLLKDHTLVTTGPYSYVRHPGYTGGSMVLAGLLIWYSAPGSWVRESGFYEYPLAWLAIGPSVACVLLTLKMYAARPPLEDEILRKEFGEQWDAWAKKVPYMVYPGIF